jgi:nucleolar protein 58
VKEAAEISMGTEISEEDIINIKHLCQQVCEIQEYRGQLYDYLKNRMIAIAPNLTILVGELVGARLISHAGSLMNLAKHPASTVQILGAEKALFKALKTKHDTPKYGLIYHAQLVGQASAKLKGKVSRMLAAKAAIATRVDALGEETNTDLGIEHRAKVETRIRQLEGGQVAQISGSAKKSAKFDKFEAVGEAMEYKAAADVTSGKRKSVDSDDEEEKPKVKKIKVEDVEVKSEKKKKKKKDKVAEDEIVEEVMETSEIKTEEKKKKKKEKEVPEEANSTLETTADASLLEEGGEKKKKKKKKKE